MGIIVDAGRNTNWSNNKTKTIPVVIGDSSPIAGSLVERDEFGGVVDYWNVDENSDIAIRANCQYEVTKEGEKKSSIVTTDEYGTSNDLTILKTVGEYFKLGFTGVKAILQIRKVG